MKHLSTTQRVLLVASFMLVVISSAALFYGLARVLPWYAWVVVALNVLFMVAFTNILKTRALERERKDANGIEASEPGKSWGPYGI
jgi:membrane protein implicated in regulation of membrane protease activity